MRGLGQFTQLTLWQRLLFAVVTTCSTALVFAGMALSPTAKLPQMRLAASCSTTSANQSYAYTGTEQCFVVPAGVQAVHVTLTGGYGGDGYVSGADRNPGFAAVLNATVDVTSGETLFVEVGGPGTFGNLCKPYNQCPVEPGTGRTAGSGGCNGGGDGGLQRAASSSDSLIGGGGGGETDIRTTSIGGSGTLCPFTSCSGGIIKACFPVNPACSGAATLASRLLVAGGGGGGGDSSDDNPPSGVGGTGGYGGRIAGDGASGTGTGSSLSIEGGGGAGASSTAGGSGGLTSSYAPGSPGKAGAQPCGGAGGAGSANGDTEPPGGGGGGAGYYGGGGGGGAGWCCYLGGAPALHAARPQAVVASLTRIPALGPEASYAAPATLAGSNGCCDGAGGGGGAGSSAALLTPHICNLSFATAGQVSDGVPEPNSPAAVISYPSTPCVATAPSFSNPDTPATSLPPVVPCAAAPSLQFTPAASSDDFVVEAVGSGWCSGPVTLTWTETASRPESAQLGTVIATGCTGPGNLCSFVLQVLLLPHDALGKRTLLATQLSVSATADLLVGPSPGEPPRLLIRR